MFFKNSYLELCKKAFDKHNLKLYKGLYPACFEDNKGRSGEPTRQQFKVCDILLRNKIPFILEHKIKSAIHGHFYCDIFAKGKYHFFDIEIDGEHHYTLKSQIKRDCLKEEFLLKNHSIITIRIPNKIVDNDLLLMEELKTLNTQFFTKETEYHFIQEEMGAIKCRKCRAK